MLHKKYTAEEIFNLSKLSLKGYQYVINKNNNVTSLEYIAIRKMYNKSIKDIQIFLDKDEKMTVYKQHIMKRTSIIKELFQ